MEHLISNYGHGYARPVKDGNKPTKVYLRCLLGELIEMVGLDVIVFNVEHIEH